MKTKQEQIEEMQEIIGDSYEYDSISAELGSGDGYINTEEAAKALMQAGYGDVSEYKAEIERLKTETKQAQIDVLNKVKKCDVCGAVPLKYIDIFIEEVQGE